MSDIEHVDESVRGALSKLEDLSEVRDGVISARWPISVYEMSDGQVKIRSFFFNEDLADAERRARIGRDYCSARRLLDVAGYATTLQNGEVEISLNAFHCLARPPQAGENFLGYEQPINVVATPRGDQPAFLAVRTRIDTSTVPADVKITVAAWDAGGAPAGGLSFNWRCLIPIIEIVG